MTERLQQIFQDRLLLARRRIGMSQEALAKETGLFKTDISKYERGHAMPSLPKLVRLADALCTTIDDLIGRTVPEIFSTYFCETEVDLDYGWRLGQTAGAVFILGPGNVMIQLDGFQRSKCTMEPRVPLDAVEAQGLVSWCYHGYDPESCLACTEDDLPYMLQLNMTSLLGEITYRLSLVSHAKWPLPLKTGQRLAAWWTAQLLPEDTP